MTHHNQLVAGYGERLAGRYLVSQGLVILDRNWLPPAGSPRGELDLIARDGADVVFVEVKTRRSVRYGGPAEAVVPSKARRLRRLALQWLAANDATYRNVRFDVVSILLRRPIAVQHLRGAF
ncbi:YraN family protein [Dactylosporangium sp. AC04546]|uniref:YraN family protein n=1 Tax=Dactylosporangium sp. AC04546 TaxID=2862460 RepID=UPI001EDCDF73|nr:YraN family protein [Dactylosporangium sp. AC04546]WVK85264.1 YraN family protein [Dactylosporangium sp. AC04546]